MTTVDEHIHLAEVGLEQAKRQEADFSLWAKRLRSLDPEALSIAQLQQATVLISLTGAQVHATLAVAKGQGEAR